MANGHDGRARETMDGAPASWIDDGPESQEIELGRIEAEAHADEEAEGDTKAKRAGFPNPLRPPITFGLSGLGNPAAMAGRKRGRASGRGSSQKGAELRRSMETGPPEVVEATGSSCSWPR